MTFSPDRYLRCVACATKLLCMATKISSLLTIYERMTQQRFWGKNDHRSHRNRNWKHSLKTLSEGTEVAWKVRALPNLPRLERNPHASSTTPGVHCIQSLEDLHLHQLEFQASHCQVQLVQVRSQDGRVLEYFELSPTSSTRVLRSNNCFVLLFVCYHTTSY
jgi:hypothetical protein